jgi:hypothetical protein
MDNLDALIDAIASRSAVSHVRKKSPQWSPEEITFLHANAGRLDDEEIGRHLGRSKMGVKVFRVRQGLRCMSQSKTHWASGHAVARMLGVDAHKVVSWCKSGLISSIVRRDDASGREYFLIRLDVLKQWAVNPNHWVYFEPRRVTDPHLNRLCALRAQRWGDEWWSTTQVAAYHGVQVGDVKRYIKAGLLKAYRPEFPLGGRDPGQGWRFWFVRKSDATHPNVRFKCRGDDMSSYTPRADEWILRARDELGFSWATIARTMVRKSSEGVRLRYMRLKGRYM